MTKFLKIRQRFIVLALCAFAVACNDDDSTTTSPTDVGSETIYESAIYDSDIRKRNEGLKNFITAAEAANGDFVSILDGSSDITVLVPGNTAFEDFAKKIGYADFDEMITNIDKDVLADIISYHIIDGKLNTSSLSGEVTTNSGDTLVFGTNGDNQTIAEDGTELPSTNTAGILIGPNQERSNGVIHSINKVLLSQDIITEFSIDIRPNLYELAKFHEYTTLITAVDKAGQQDALTGADRTLFIPSNAAIAGLLDYLGDDYDSLGDFDNAVEMELLSSIIKYHLFQPETDLVDGTHVTLLDGNSLSITSGGTEVDDYSATNATVVETEIGEGAVNGVAYEINKFLISQTVEDFLDELASDDLFDVVSAQGSLSILEQAIAAVDEENFEEVEALKAKLKGVNLEENLNDVTNVSIREKAENESDEDYADYLSDINPGYTYYDKGTVFAPSDAAFQDLFNSMTGYSSIADFDTTEERRFLLDIILYHMVPGSVTADSIGAGEIATQLGETISVQETLSEIITLTNSSDNVNASITTADLDAKNGLVHIIDTVLLPESALEFISFID